MAKSALPKNKGDVGVKQEPEITIQFSDDLNEIQCSECGDEDCGTKHMSAKCHPKAGLDVFYDDEAEVLCFQCHECGQPVTVVAVASAPCMCDDCRKKFDAEMKAEKKAARK